MYGLAVLAVCVAAIAAWLLVQSQRTSFPAYTGYSGSDLSYTVYNSQDLGVTLSFPRSVFSLDTTERKQGRLFLRDGEGQPLVQVLRTALPEHKDVKVGREQEIEDLKRMDYTLTYVAPEKEQNWSNWYVLSGVKRGTEFYFRRWYSDDSVVSLEFIYPKELAALFEKLIPTMTHEFAFTAASPKADVNPLSVAR